MTWTCSYCGAPNLMEWGVCYKCGKTLRPKYYFGRYTR